MYLEISVADLCTMCTYNLLNIVIVLKNSKNYFVSMKTYFLYYSNSTSICLLKFTLKFQLQTCVEYLLSLVIILINSEFYKVWCV